MAKHKVRADARKLAKLVTDAGIPLDTFTPAQDGWHSFQSLSDGIVAGLMQGQERRHTATGPWGEQDPIDWALLTGRITASSAEHWRADLARDPAGIGKVLAELGASPSLAAQWTRDPATGHAVPAAIDQVTGLPMAAATRHAPSATPLLDALDEANYGPPQDERWRREDLQAEREAREILDREAEQARANAMTEDERRAMYPPGKDQKGN